MKTVIWYKTEETPEYSCFYIMIDILSISMFSFSYCHVEWFNQKTPISVPSRTGKAEKDKNYYDPQMPPAFLVSFGWPSISGAISNNPFGKDRVQGWLM